MRAFEAARQEAEAGGRAAVRAVLVGEVGGGNGLEPLLIGQTDRALTARGLSADRPTALEWLAHCA